MFKKLVSFVGALSLLISSAAPVFAADFQADLIASPLVLSVSPSGDPQAFQPASNQTLNYRVNFTQTIANGSISVQIKKDATTVKTFTVLQDLDQSVPLTGAWNGKEIDNNAGAQGICGIQGAACPDGNYTLNVTVSAPSGVNILIESDAIAFRVGAAQSITINSFSLTPLPVANSGTFDPSLNGDNQDLQISYALNQAADNVNLEIRDSKNNILKSFNSSLVSSNFTWDGQFDNKLVVPGTYLVKITATKAGEGPVTISKNFTVAYNNPNKGEIQNLDVEPESFDPDFEEALIEFVNTKDSDVTVEIQDINGAVVRKFDDYKNQNYDSNEKHTVDWDGSNDSGSDVALGMYKAVVVTRNDFGAVLAEHDVRIDNDGVSIPSSNAHISGISLDPSSKFEPAEDEELKIEFDVKQELDTLKIFAVRGGESVKLYDEEGVEEENNLEITWDGTLDDEDNSNDDDDDDDDDFAKDGDWLIRFDSERKGTKLVAGETINLDYEKPEITDFFLSKEKFDNEAGEFTYAIFRVDTDAEVTIKEFLDNEEEDEVVEDMEVLKDKWYAVQWDGGSFDNDDELDLKLIAENIANSDVFDSEKVDVELEEDEVSSNRANVTNDYIEPVVTDGNEEMVIYYDLEEEADVRVTIHSGKSGSGAEKIELLDTSDQDSGEHSINWDGRDKNGNKLADGSYTYKIVAKTGGTETETGVFVVGEVGDVDGGGSSGGSDDDDDNDDDDDSGDCVPGIVIDGKSCDDDGDDDDDDVIEPPILDTCGSFIDVMAEDSRCEAIQWVEEQGIFKGYADGSFKADQNINRVELLKVILEAMSEGPSVAAGNLGFMDVQPGAWYMGYIARAKSLGIFSGDAGKGTARPGDFVNRVEALKILAETLRATKGFKVPACEDVNYSDVSKTGWFFNYVCFNEQYSLFEEVSLMIFSPGRPASRGELAEALFELHLGGLL